MFSNLSWELERSSSVCIAWSTGSASVDLLCPMARLLRRMATTVMNFVFIAHLLIELLFQNRVVARLAGVLMNVVVSGLRSRRTASLGPRLKLEHCQMQHHKLH